MNFPLSPFATPPPLLPLRIESVYSVQMASLQQLTIAYFPHAQQIDQFSGSLLARHVFILCTFVPPIGKLGVVMVENGVSVAARKSKQHFHLSSQ